MSTFNYEPIIQQLPGAIEEIRTVHLQQIPASVEIGKTAAKASGAPQFQKDADRWEEVVAINTDFVKRIFGVAGDTVGDTGSLEAFVAAAMKIRKAVGGDM